MKDKCLKDQESIHIQSEEEVYFKQSNLNKLLQFIKKMTL